MDTLKVIANSDSLKRVIDSLKSHAKGSMPATSGDSVYVVLAIVVIVWTGIFFYLLNLDRRLKKLEKEEKEK
jgi:CcmD family protein